MTSPLLIGREREKRLLIDLIDGVQRRGATLVLRGEAGIGKSRLLALATDYAQESGVRVLTTAGCESETHLPFAGLHRLLRPVLQGIDHLPTPQRTALQAAFGIIGETAPNPFLIALAVLSLLSDVAAEAPLLLVAEDAHWLDRPTNDVLTFVARRLESDPIVLLVAAREGIECPLVGAGLPDLHLERLDEAAAAALLDAHAPELAPAVRKRLLENAAGIPLALVELPLALRTAGVVGETLTTTWMPLTTHLEQLFANRIASLPKDTRTLLLVAAADEYGTLDESLEAAAVIAGRPLTVAAMDPAVAAELVSISGLDLHFRHPLIRSAVYQLASPSERQSAHAALATKLTDELGRRVWHRAHAAFGTDEEIAAELETAAERAQQRGMTAIAITTLERAAQLTEHRTRKGRRLLYAAELAYQLGRSTDVIRLLDAAEHAGLEPVDFTRLALIREVLKEGAWSGAARLKAFVEIADQMNLEGNTERALDALVAVALRCYWSNPDAETRDLIVKTTEKIPVPEDDPRVIYILALADPVACGTVILERLSHLNLGSGDDPESFYILGDAAMSVGDYERALGLFEDSVSGLRVQGRLGLLAQTLTSQAWTGVNVGNWNLARRAAEEAEQFERDMGQAYWMIVAQLAKAASAAYRGDTENSEALSASAEAVLLPTGANPLLALVQLVRGAAALSDGRYADAFAHLHRIFDSSDYAYHPYVRNWVFADLVEAAVHSDHFKEARALLGDLEALATKTHSPLLRIALNYARPLLAAGDAEMYFQESLRADLEHWPFYRARLLFAYGEWLRRQRRVAESREPLRTARNMFDALGAAAWSERARTELRASGITSQPRTVGASDILSPQELHIAQLAAEGLSNREIGQQLYLSPRTVASHLYRVFPKLGITSRHQLPNTLVN